MSDVNPHAKIEFLLAKLEEFPTLPEIVQELSNAIANPMSSTTQIESILSKDISMTTKVLKLVNSAYYGIPGGVTSLSRAIGFLGFDTVHQLVLSASIFSALEKVECDNFSIGEFWKHSIGTGMAAETIARITKHKTPADLFTCGLVHDLGKLVYIVIAPEIFKSLLDQIAKDRCSFTDAEAKLNIPSHTVIGQALAERWALPKGIQNTILYHHQKDPVGRLNLSPEMQKNTDIVFLANLFIHGLNFGNSGHTQIQSAPKFVFDRLNLNPKELPQLSREITKALGSADAFLQVLSGGMKKIDAA